MSGSNNNELNLSPSIDSAFVVDLPIIVKASPYASRQGYIEFECSNEHLDQEGDVILQSALLESAKGFLAAGVIDIDHLSEIGHRLGIANPEEYIVGVPLSVTDGGGGRTLVKGKLHKGVAKAESLWETLSRDPPIVWWASIYGFPTSNPDSFVDCRIKKCPEAPDAKRFVIKHLIWKSLALTRNPINDSIIDNVRIVSAKSYLANMIAKGAGGLFGAETTAVTFPAAFPTAPSATPIAGGMLVPRDRLELMAHHALHIQRGQCPWAGDQYVLGRSVATFRVHFCECCGMDYNTADIYALALMQLLKHAL
jgi:hypothetical protein